MYYTTAKLLEAARTNDCALIREIIQSGTVGIDSFGAVLPADRARFPQQNSAMIPVPNQMTALQIACIHGHLAAVKTFVSLGANVNIKSDLPVLHCSIISDNVEIFKYLTGVGADMNATTQVRIPQTRSNNTFFSEEKKSTSSSEIPVFQNYSSLDSLLSAINAGSDLSAHIKSGALKQDTKGSCLYQALARGHKAQVMQLLGAGESVTAKHYFAAGLSHKKTSSPQDIYNLLPKTLTKSTEQDSRLYFALAAGNEDLVVDLLVEGCDALVKNKHFYAAGLCDDMELAQKLYKIITAAQAVREPDFRSNNIYDILGVSNLDSINKITARYRSLAVTYQGDRSKLGKITNAYELIKAKDEDVSASPAYKI